MPRKFKQELPPLNSGDETIGDRLARFRKRQGMTQQALADSIGITRVLVSDYEIGRLHLNDEMIIRFALALHVSADEILGISDKLKGDHFDLKITKRMRKIQELPITERKALLKTIDAYLQAAEAKKNK